MPNPGILPVKKKGHSRSYANSGLNLHGRSLKQGEHRLKHLLRVCQDLGDPPASKLSPQDFARYRSQRLQIVSENTVNHDHAYLRAVFNELARVGEYHGDNPLEKIRQFKLDESELTYLDKSDIEVLIAATGPSMAKNPHVRMIILICLATGARWGEAEGLKINQVKDGRISFNKTKSRKNRHIPISYELEQQLIKHHQQHKLPGGQLFGPSYDAFTHALRRSGIELPAGQRTHVLRHTFASHFIKNGGNILALQRALGHADIKMTMRYAHLAPDHLEQVRELNLTGHLLDTDQRAVI